MRIRNELSGFGFKEYPQDEFEVEMSDIILSTSVPEYELSAGGKGQAIYGLTDFERFLLGNKRKT
jgi:hypothetical protein